MNNSTPYLSSNKEITSEQLHAMHHRLHTIYASAESFHKVFPGFDHREYQYTKLDKLLQGLIDQQGGKIDKKMLADITPPSGGKTFLMLVMAYLMREQGIPSVIGMRNASSILGPDNAFGMFSKIFGADNIGIVDKDHKVFDKPITFVVANSLANHADTLLAHHSTMNLMLDEGDAFQTDLRQGAIQKLINNATTFTTMYSGTTLLNGRDLSDIAHITDRLALIDLISMGYSKQIVAQYYQGDICVADENIRGNRVDFDTLSEIEKQRMVQSARSIYERHLGEKFIIHCSNIQQARDTYTLFASHGVITGLVTEKTSDSDRRAVETGYIHGNLSVLINVGVYGRALSEEGVTQGQIYGDITGSRSDIYQKVLRGIRPHKVHKLLYLYQLIPSTIRSKNFIPILLSDIFHVDPRDAATWISYHSRSDIRPSSDTPIRFATETGTETPGLISDHAKPSDTSSDSPRTTGTSRISFASQDDIVTFLDSRDLQETQHQKMVSYISAHFMNIMKTYLHEADQNIFDIPSISNTAIVDIIQHDDDTCTEISYQKLCRGVFSYISGLSGRVYDKGYVALTTKRIQTRYASGSAPVFNARLNLYELDQLKHQHITYKDDFIANHAMDIYALFDPPEKIKKSFYKKEIEFGGLPITYSNLLINILHHTTQRIDYNIARSFVSAANQIARLRDQTGQKPTSSIAWKHIFTSIVDVNNYAKDTIKSILGSIAEQYHISIDDLRHCIINGTETITLTLDKQQLTQYCQTYNPQAIKYINHLNETETIHKTTNIKHLMEGIMRSTFSSSDLQRLSLKRKNIYYTNSQQQALFGLILSDNLTSDTVYHMLNQEDHTTQYNNIKIEDYSITKNIDLLSHQWDNMDTSNTTISTIQEHDPIRISFFEPPKEVSIRTVSSSVFQTLTQGANISTWRKELGISDVGMKKALIRLLIQYSSDSPEQRILYKRENIKALFTIRKGYFKKTDKPLPTIMDTISYCGQYDKLNELAITIFSPCIGFNQLRQNITKFLDTIFVDSETLHNYGLCIADFKKIAPYLNSLRESAIAEINLHPDNFMQLRIERALTNNTRSLDHATTALDTTDTPISTKNTAKSTEDDEHHLSSTQASGSDHHALSDTIVSISEHSVKQLIDTYPQRDTLYNLRYRSHKVLSLGDGTDSDTTERFINELHTFVQYLIATLFNESTDTSQQNSYKLYNHFFIKEKHFGSEEIICKLHPVFLEKLSLGGHYIKARKYIISTVNAIIENNTPQGETQKNLGETTEQQNNTTGNPTDSSTPSVHIPNKQPLSTLNNPILDLTILSRWLSSYGYPKKQTTLKNFKLLKKAQKRESEQESIIKKRIIDERINLRKRLCRDNHLEDILCQYIVEKLKHTKPEKPSDFITDITKLWSDYYTTHE